MTRVALYARYSSDRQNERSIADQLDVLRRHASNKGWTVVGAFEDAAISGAAMANRPGLLTALAVAEAGGFDLLLAEDEDRLARNLEHMAHIANRLEDAGVGIATLTNDRVEGLHVAWKGFMAQDYLRVLGQKTRRGMASNAEKGLATGSRLYGYRSQPGGQVEIVPEQAEVIRRIFAMYADERMSARDIASQLNTEGVPSPTGRMWNTSTIMGSRQRANGILHSEIYAGVKVFGRVEMRKDRQTGKRVTICKPPSEHRRIPVPRLAIIERDLWDRAQDRIQTRACDDPSRMVRLRRRPGLLSGLVKCGRCGSSYTSLSAGRLVCAGYRERGLAACTNRRHLSRAMVEERVLTGLRDRLLAPEAVAAYVRAYHEAWQERTATAVHESRPLQRRLGEVERALERGTEALLSGAVAGETIGRKLAELEAEKVDLLARLAEIEAGARPPVQLHPRAAERYADEIAQLQAYLQEHRDSAAPAAAQLVDAARALIQRIDIEPVTDLPRSEVRITLHGDLARFVRPAEAECGGKLVAGGGLEPPTCGL